MGKINVLSFEVANLIAAGEVVDRPASAIKELIENSIDAGATQISVETKAGGVTYMRVTDNGCGISEEDLPTAVLRHATSKIRDASDLDAILTLGFRGEALAAIAAVSELRILSKTPDSDVGHMLQVRNGEVLSLSECGGRTGTTVIAEQLFANVPARRKFLKRDITETMAVAATVEKIALSHPEIAFTLVCDGSSRIETSGDGSLMHCIRALFGKDFAGKLLDVDGESGGIRVTGFIGRTDNVKANRNGQIVFINNRYVRSKTVSASLEQAFSSYCPAERFPVCVLFLTLSASRVDVNVHPSKLEVKFTDERPVFEAVYQAVRAALERNVSRPEMEPPRQDVRWKDAYAPAVAPKGDSLSGRQFSIHTEGQGGGFFTMTAEDYRKAVTQGRMPGTEGANPPAKDIPQAPVSHAPSSPPAPDPVPSPAPDTQKGTPEETPAPFVPPEYRIVGEIFNTYILVELPDRMLMIDKHAAHERLNFERFKEIQKQSEKGQQLLAVPIEVMMTSSEIAALESFRTDLESLGFSFRTARNTVWVDAVPDLLKDADVGAILQTFAGQIQDATGIPSLTRDLVFEKALYQVSCKASIKGGRVYTEEDNRWIVDSLMRLPDITFCPHGRPVAMEMTKHKIEHQFERI
ncbi:MAG: DNA mismatch repair endonuclease MutL [Clostridia bacterium]|nr:DNA mismatch repair endonuclease MutL [Clostridia bacterium]